MTNARHKYKTKETKVCDNGHLHILFSSPFLIHLILNAEYDLNIFVGRYLV